MRFQLLVASAGLSFFADLLDDGGAAAAAGGGLLLLLLFVVFGVIGAGVYFVPTFIAFARNKSNKIAILALNFFLGWSVLGWVISLIWALTNEAQPQQVVVYQQMPQPVAPTPAAPPSSPAAQQLPPGEGPKQ